jgi:hypothetical protein
MTDLEKRLITILYEIDLKNVLSATTDPLQPEIHNLLQTLIDPEYNHLTIAKVKEYINNL